MAKKTVLPVALALILAPVSTAGAVTVKIPATVTSGDDTVNAGKTEVVIFGGGSSTIALPFRSLADCFGDKINLGLNGSVGTQNAYLDFRYLGYPSETCGTTGLIQPGAVVSYISTGSGRGILGFFSHNPLYSMGQGNKDTWLFDGTSTKAVSGSADRFYGTKVNFAVAEAGLPLSDTRFGGDLNTYYNGGYITANNLVIQIADQPGRAPTGWRPNCTNDPNNPCSIVTTLYPNPLKTYGPAIQIPLMVAAPVVAFSPVYKKVRLPSNAIGFYRFSTAQSPGSLKFTNTQLCAIFAGKIINWNQLPTTTVNKDPRDPAPFSVPLQIVARGDDSGSGRILFNHLRKVCGSLGYGIAASSVAVDPDTPNTAPAGESVGYFTIVKGELGMATYLAFLNQPVSVGYPVVQGRIGYLGQNSVLPYVLQQNSNNYGLFSASLQNANGAFVNSTPSAAATAVSVVIPPQSDAQGTYVPSAVNKDGTSSVPASGYRYEPASNPGTYAWTSTTTIDSPLADPTTIGSYPLVGTVNALFYQCYSDAAEAALVRNFISWYYTSLLVNDRSRGLLVENGFAPVSAGYTKAILDTFITNARFFVPGRGNIQLGLDIEQSGGASPTPACTGVQGA